MQRPEDGEKGPKGGGARDSFCPELGPLEVHNGLTLWMGG